MNLLHSLNLLPWRRPRRVHTRQLVRWYYHWGYTAAPAHVPGLPFQRIRSCAVRTEDPPERYHMVRGFSLHDERGRAYLRSAQALLPNHPNPPHVRIFDVRAGDQPIIPPAALHLLINRLVATDPGPGISASTV